MPIEFVRPDWATLAGEWRALEAGAHGSFFQSWSWVGCLAQQRYDDPWLVRATQAARVVGLALFNRTGPPLARTLRLHETGRRADDTVFIEHNGPLLARGCEALRPAMLAAALRRGRLVLGGVDDAVLRDAGTLGRCSVTATRPAPFAALDGLSPAAWLESLGASTRYQLRRSRRRYQATGTLSVRRAADVAEGLAFLAALAALHQVRWTGRGRPGAFAEPAFTAFHQALVAAGLPRGEVDLVRVGVSGPSPAVIGYLYNFRWRDRVYAYQSGFDYAAAGLHQLPGLTCHHAAIDAAIASQAAVYDFLAGEARYKTSLGNGVTQMHWAEVTRPLTLHGLWRPIRSFIASSGLGGRV